MVSEQNRDALTDAGRESMVMSKRALFSVQKTAGSFVLPVSVSLYLCLSLRLSLPYLISYDGIF